MLTGTGLQLVGRLGTAAFSLSASVLIGRHLGDDGFGRFNYYFTLFLVVGALVDFGSMAIAVREATRHPDREQAIVRATFRLRLIAVAACLLVCAAVAWRREGSLTGAALPILASLHLLVVAPTIAAAWLQVRVRYAAIAVAPLLGFGLYLAAAVLMRRAGLLDPRWFVVAFGGALLLQALVPWLAASRHVALLGPVERPLMGELFRAMAPLGLSAALSTLYFRIDALLLNELHGDVANGRWAKTFMLLSFSIALPTYLAGALFPSLTRAATRSPEALVALVRRVGVVLMAVALPAVALAAAWGGQVLWLLWARRGAVEPFDSFVVANDDLRRCLPLLALAGVAIFLAIPQMLALTALGRQRTLLVVTARALVVKLVIGFLAIRAWGVLGAALATVATEWFVTLSVSIELKRAAGGTIASRAMARPLVVALLIGAAAWPFAGLAPGFALAGALLFEAAAIALAGAWPLRLGVDS